MIVALIYVMTCAGVEAATGKFWVAAFWPYHLGEIIGQAIKNASTDDTKKD